MQAAYQRAMDAFDRRWADGKGTRPERLPGGHAFEPDPLIAVVRDGYWRSIHETDLEDDPDFMGTILLLSTVNELASAQPSMTFVQAVAAVRESMLRRGAVQDADAFGALALYITRWWQESGAWDAWIASLDGLTAAQLREFA
jgi:hypothetical protein